MTLARNLGLGSSLLFLLSFTAVAGTVAAERSGLLELAQAQPPLTEAEKKKKEQEKKKGPPAASPKAAPPAPKAAPPAPAPKAAPPPAKPTPPPPAAKAAPPAEKKAAPAVKQTPQSKGADQPKKEGSRAPDVNKELPRRTPPAQALPSLPNRDDDRRFDGDDRYRDRDRPRDSYRGRDGDWRRGDHRWELLGEKIVGFRIDRDVIDIGQREEWYRDRRYRALHFLADGNDVYMIRIRLVYLNGYSEDFRVDRLIRQGEELPMDLRGDRSYLGRIEMIYRSRPDFRGEAVIKVYGEPTGRFSGPPPGPPPFPGPDRAEWIELGCKQVALFGKDRDTIPVGRQEGRFKAIRLLVRGADVEMLDLRVIYADGEPDDIPVRHLIPADSRTRPLDLKGFERSIRRVDLVYRTAVNPLDIIARQRIGVATVCVEGLQ